MKKTIILGIVLAFSAVTIAQSNKEDIEIIQGIFGKQKKELVNTYMAIPEKQSTKFWSLYDVYETERKKLGKERIALIEDYANHFDKLTNAKATELANKKIAWTMKYAKFQQTYFTKFAAVIGGVQAAKWLQLEDYIENCVRVSIADEIPFIGSIEKTKNP
jgi:hypothetical protein